MIYLCILASNMISMSYAVLVVSNMTGSTSGAGTAYPSEASEFTSVFLLGSCYSILSVVFCRSLFVLLIFFFIVCPSTLYCLSFNIVLSVLQHCIVVLQHCIVCPSTLYCLSFNIVLSVLQHCIVCPSTLYCLSFNIVLSVLQHCIVCPSTLYCLSFNIVLSVLQHCIVCPSIYIFWLSL